MSCGPICRVLLGTTASFATSASHAQVAGQPSPPTADAAASAPTDDATNETVGDIIVTARRREESLQSVPVSIAAFSGNTLTERNIAKLEDLTQIVPGLTSQSQQQGNAALTFSVRGQRQVQTNIGYESPVAVYQDEIIQSRPQGLKQSFFDISNVQVLKGPQGTLFGRNVTGGAVLVNSQKPTDRLEGYLTVTAGSYGLVRGEGAVNIPLSPAFQLRFAGTAISRDGWINNPFVGRKVDNESSQAWRGSLRTVLGDGTFENNLIVSGSHQRQDATVYKVFEFTPQFTAPGLLSPATVAAVGANLAFLQTQPFRTSTSNVPKDGINNRVFGITNTTSVEVGKVTFRNIFGYRNIRNQQYYDLSGQSTLLADSQQTFSDNQYSDEFQVLGTILDERLDFVAGLYYFNESGSEQQFTRILAPGPNNTITDFSAGSKSYAGYGQVTYRPAFVENISLTAGLRYTRDERFFEQRARFVSGVCRVRATDVGGSPVSPCVRDAETNFENPTYTFSADWKFDGKNMIYLAHRYGYQAGGFTNSALRPIEFTPYRPQTVKDFEVGLKTQWTVGSISGRANVAAYRGNYKDIQRILATVTTDPITGLPFVPQRIQNAASAVIQGIEFDSRIDFNRIFAVDLSYSFTDAKYKNFIVGGVDFTRSQFSGTPKHTLSAAARMHLPVSEDIAETHLQMSGSYQSSSVTQDLTSFDPVAQITRPVAILPGFTILNARLDLEKVGGRPLRLSFYVRNLLDKEYFIGGADATTSIGASTRLLGDPRTFGVEASYRF